MTTNAVTKKNKVGRPSKYESIDLALVSKYAGEGFGNEDIAALLNISATALYDYQKRYPKFYEALHRGKAKANENVVAALYKNCIGGFVTGKSTRYDKNGNVIEEKEYYAAPNTLAQIFWLKNREQATWKDKFDHDLSVRDYKHDELKDSDTESLRQEAVAAAQAIIANPGRVSVSKEDKPA